MTGPKQLAVRSSHAERAKRLIQDAYQSSMDDEAPISRLQSEIDHLRRANEAAGRLVHLIEEIGAALAEESVRVSERTRIMRQVLYGPPPWNAYGVADPTE